MGTQRSEITVPNDHTASICKPHNHDLTSPQKEHVSGVGLQRL
jgi:hypothetical protein